MSQDSAERDLAGLALAWSKEWGEETPRDIQWVLTTRDEAMRLLYGNVGSVSDAAYLITFRGDFSQLRDTGKSAHGVWAALLVDQNSMHVRTFTVRPQDFIPEIDLSALGEVHDI